MNARIFTRRKPGFESHGLEKELKTNLNLNPNFALEEYVIYDIFNADQEDLALLKEHVLTQPLADETVEPELEGKTCLAYEYLPGQYDQRADAAMQCLMLLNQKEGVSIRSGFLLVMENASEEDVEKIAAYVINPVESRKKDLNVLTVQSHEPAKPVKVLEDFLQLDAQGLANLHKELGLAMSLEDLAFVQEHFQQEGRAPYLTEIRVLDTYWSDHCRHTTFETVLDDVQIEGEDKDFLEAAKEKYESLRETVHGGRKPSTLMDMATVAGKALRKAGKLDDLEVSDEINACSVQIQADVNGQMEDWLFMFKNETHNHPTEIEPFGGAATCIGGAIRDPLSGRSYVYQAMRITGAADITEPLEKTLENKLPQSKISKTAAKGYSSYGNQIGLATTFVEELFDEGYKAKRMEVGAVAGAAPKKNVRREKPEAGDVILLVGGATGRDGIGGATGSSKEHNDTSLQMCSSEVQKGNALTERKLQRLFRNPRVSALIKKANDFGAGGVSVAVGELADGLEINLDAVPVKYAGLDGTELAISESQERMAVCVPAKDAEEFEALCHEENLGCVKVAEVTEEPRLIMKWRGDVIADLDRAFLDTNGVRQHQNVFVDAKHGKAKEAPKTLEEAMSRPETACQSGLAEMFDASIGKSTVLMPFGGKKQRTPEMGSVQKLPVDGFTNTASVMTYGFDPALSAESPYTAAAYSVAEALARLTAMGADPFKARLSNQEYFRRLGTDEEAWGHPYAALLGLIEAQMAFETPSIGGKDSMSGTFKDIHVPDTVITFAADIMDARDVISAAFKPEGSYLYVLDHVHGLQPDYERIKENFRAFDRNRKHIVAASALKNGGIGAAAAKMAFGNEIGFEIETENPYAFGAGDILVQTDERIEDAAFKPVGKTKAEPAWKINEEEGTLEDLFKVWTKRYDALYPRFANQGDEEVPVLASSHPKQRSKVKVSKPKVLIPVFPGQNCEYDLTAQFERAGADVKQLVFNNETVDRLQESIDVLAKEIEDSQILMLAGGFSSSDEPDGSGKFIANVLKNKQVAKAIEKMRANDGLILGICNGFQALVKSGLLPGNGQTTLFYNDIGRHVSRIASTRVASNLSPWLEGMEPGTVHGVAVSHGEGKFMADKAVLEELAAKGQIAFQYSDLEGHPSMAGDVNPNGSFWAVEGITSEDGRILGKMGHSERWEPGLFQNIPMNLDQNIFKNGVRFFTHEED